MVSPRDVSGPSEKRRDHDSTQAYWDSGGLEGGFGGRCGPRTPGAAEMPLCHPDGRCSGTDHVCDLDPRRGVMGCREGQPGSILQLAPTAYTLVGAVANDLE